MMFYLGADHPLPTTKDWSKVDPRFHVVPAPKMETIIRGHLGTTYVVYAGSHEGCGCGFAYESEAEYRASLEGIPDVGVINTCTEDRQQRKQTVADLGVYLQAATRSGPVRLLATWAGEEATMPEHHLAMTLDDFGRDGFLIERFTVVDIIQKAQLPVAD